jgi:transcriptional regulator GlxA family with amidase domain
MRCEQTLSLCTRMDLRNAVVAQAVTIMQEHLEAPLSPAAIAAAVGVSPRQLERLFARHLGASPKVHYMKLRMQHARSLLLQTDMQVIDVGIAAGFNSASHFGKLYRRHFGVSPHRERGFHTAGPA